MTSLFDLSLLFIVFNVVKIYLYTIFMGLDVGDNGVQINPSAVIPIPFYHQRGLKMVGYYVNDAICGRVRETHYVRANKSK